MKISWIIVGALVCACCFVAGMLVVPPMSEDQIKEEAEGMIVGYSLPAEGVCYFPEYIEIIWEGSQCEEVQNGG